MVNNVAIRFLGTSSQTCVTRNYSSLLVKLDHQTVMVDCGESTQRQLLNRHIGDGEKLGSIRKILVTHLHMDHVSGLVPFLCSMMGPGSSLSSNEKVARVEIFGPLGLRALLRSTFSLCYTTLSAYYTVHELLWPGQKAYPSNSFNGNNIQESAEPLIGAANGPIRIIPCLPLLEYELPGKDFRMDEETASWPHITSVEDVSISAAPLLHRCPALGYVFEESASSSTSATPEMISALNANAAALLKERNIKNPKILLSKIIKDRQTVTLPDGTILQPPILDRRGRKIVVLGDTYDATAGLQENISDSVNVKRCKSIQRGMLGLARDADLLIHECTNAALPGSLQQGNKKVDEKREEVRAKALLRGHSTPQVAGSFAGKCGAQQLILNHLSIKYPAPTNRSAEWNLAGRNEIPRDEAERRYMAINEIERQATDAWHEAIRDCNEIHTEIARKRRAIVAYDGFIYRVSKLDEEEIIDDKIDKLFSSSEQFDDQHHGNINNSLSYRGAKNRRGQSMGRSNDYVHSDSRRVYRGRFRDSMLSDPSGHRGSHNLSHVGFSNHRSNHRMGVRRGNIIDTSSGIHDR